MEPEVYGIIQLCFYSCLWVTQSNKNIKLQSETLVSKAQVVGKKLGVEFKVSLDQRIAGAESIGAHKTSMLQDVEQGRPIEIEALLGSVVELGSLTHTPTPMAFLGDLLERPANEKAFLVMPVGYPAAGARVPDLSRKPIGDIAVWR